MITTTNIETELGIMIAGAVDEGICLLEFSDRKMLNTEYKDLSRYFNTTIQEGVSSHFLTIRKQMEEYFDGTRTEFSVPLITPGTAFQQSVWKELMKIPYGTTPFLS